MLIDMHAHTIEGSSCSQVSLEQTITRLMEKGFSGVLVTDHESEAGYRSLRNLPSGFTVLRGFEVSTRYGDMLLKRESITSTSDIYSRINSELEGIKKEYCSIKNRKIRQHLFYIILPAISVYQTLLNCNLSSEKAAEIIKECTYTYYKKSADFYGVLGRLPGFYVLFRAVFKLAMREYPEDGWDIEWLVNNRSEVSFNMHSCLYYDTFKKYGCPELTHIFCGVDNFCYDNMSTKVKFVRTKTIAGGHGICDFRFLKA